MDSRKRLQTASMIFGILSLVLLIVGFALPAAAMGLIFALMSRESKGFEGRALTGLILSIIGLIFGIIITASSFYLVYSGEYDRLLKEFESEYTDDPSYSDELQEWLDRLGYSSESIEEAN